MFVEKDTLDQTSSDLTNSNVRIKSPHHCNIHIILQCITISLRQHTLVAHEDYATYRAPPTKFTYHVVRRYCLQYKYVSNRMTILSYLAPIRIEQPQTNAPYTQISSHHNNHRTIMNTKPSAMRRQSTANTATHRTIHFKYRIVIDLFLYFYLTFTLVILDKSRKKKKK
eukprot:193804_1